MIKEFKGACAGVRLTQDEHGIQFRILVEDDGNWFESKEGFNAFWLPELIGVLYEAQTWMEHNCKPYVVDGRQWGWQFKC